MSREPVPVEGAEGREETAPLWKRFGRTRDRADRNRLVEAYGFMVRYAVERVGSAIPPRVLVERKSDMISAGYLGLMDAVDRFNPDRGFKFETYGSRRVHGAVLDELRKFDWAPRRLRRRGREIQEAVRSLEGETGRAAEMEDVARRLGTSQEEISRDMGEIHASFMVPLESLSLIGDDGKPYARVDFRVQDGASPAEAVEDDERLQNLAAGVRGLPDSQKKVLALYFQEGLTLKEIGVLLGVSESRISQIMKEAVRKLREGVSSGSWEAES